MYRRMLKQANLSSVRCNKFLSLGCPSERESGRSGPSPSWRYFIIWFTVRRNALALMASSATITPPLLNFHLLCPFSHSRQGKKNTFVDKKMNPRGIKYEAGRGMSSYSKCEEKSLFVRRRLWKRNSTFVGGMYIQHTMRSGERNNSSDNYSTVAYPILSHQFWTFFPSGLFLGYEGAKEDFQEPFFYFLSNFLLKKKKKGIKEHTLGLIIFTSQAKSK